MQRLVVLLTSVTLTAASFCASGCSTQPAGGMSADDMHVWRQAQHAKSTGMLDGRNFTVQLTEVGTTKSDEDTLEFAGGRFHSTACDAFGFGSGTYEAQTKGDVLTVTATCANGKGMKTSWQLSVRGDQVDGRMTCGADGEKPTEYTVMGMPQR